MSDWKAAGQAKRDAVNNLIPVAWRLPMEIPSPDEQRDVTGPYIQQFLSSREVEITESSATKILEHTLTGQWKSLEVAEAFCHRAALAHQLVSCLHEIFFIAAMEQAKQLDDYFEREKKPTGPLHGLPISLKDQFHVTGVETTMGYVGWIGTFQGEKGTGRELVFESDLVRELRKLGAVLYCKTSVPQSLMVGETVNNIIGYTWNPKNRLLSCGGSSGGEGALIALKGSPLGIGSDIGGSVRIPAAFNGLYGLKPSTGRVPYEGVANSMDGQNSLLSALGPIANSVADLQLFMKCVMQSMPWTYDPLVVEIPWREAIAGDIASRKLTFGVLRSDGLVKPHPPLVRAVNMVVEALQKAGHQVIEWEPPSHKPAVAAWSAIMTTDGGHDIHGALSLSQEPIISHIVGEYRDAPFEQQYASSIAKINVAKRMFQKEYMEYWNSTAAITGSGEPVDAVIFPVAPFAAARPGLYHYPGYSAIANYLDYATAVLPVTTADKQVDVVDSTYKPVSEVDQKVWQDYDPDIYDGAAVSVQLMGRRFQEEKILAVTDVASRALHGA